MELNGWNLVLFLSAFRLLNAACVRTYFVPDEHWQGPEVAHRLAFGYGHLTWEWREGLRSYLHPLPYTLSFKILELLHLDTPSLVGAAPYFLSGIFAVFADLALLRLAERLFDRKVAQHALICQLCCGGYFYCIARPLVNSLETVLSAQALSLWPWNSATTSVGTRRLSLAIAAVSCAVRPTGVLMFLPLGLYFLYEAKFGQKILITLEALCLGGFALLIQLLVDRACYGHWVLAHWNFLKFNLSGGASAYGVHPWHWYLSQGLATIYMSTIVPALIGAYKSQILLPMLPIISTTLAHSLLDHKEFRFLLPTAPIIMAYAGVGLTHITQYILQRRGSSAPEGPKDEDDHLKPKRNLPSNFRWWIIVVLLALSGLGPGLYLSFFHQRGPIDVVRHLARQAHGPEGETMNVLFLTPCHATPYYSMVHRNISMRFLDCSPPRLRPEHPMDETCRSEDWGAGRMSQELMHESDRFHAHPAGFLECSFQGGRGPQLPTHVVMFKGMEAQISDFLTRYTESRELFHTHIVVDDKEAASILVFQLAHGLTG